MLRKIVLFSKNVYSQSPSKTCVTLSTQLITVPIIVNVLLLIIGCLGWSATLYAQTGTINGIVVDAGDEPLAKATVSIVSATDSTVLSYTLSDDRGRFDLVRIPARSELLLYITHINSEPYRQKVTLEPKEKRNLDTIRMAGQQLDEVVVNHVAPIRLNGDTSEYKADYLNTRAKTNVEKLLQLLPGLQVNVHCTIYYHSRHVSGIRVNNKD